MLQSERKGLRPLTTLLFIHSAELLSFVFHFLVIEREYQLMRSELLADKWCCMSTCSHQLPYWLLWTNLKAIVTIIIIINMIIIYIACDLTLAVFPPCQV